MSIEPWKGNSAMRQGDDYPATVISWGMATEFCRKFTAQERQAGRLPGSWQYTLPTEAQWEVACRAGTKTRFVSGNNESELGEYAWFVANTRERREAFAHQVGQKKPNAWGLHDMHGNVWEWCRDWYQVKLPGGVDPEVTKGSFIRVLRGGSWDDGASECRSAYRGRNSPSSRFDNYGFRVACSPLR
jgi:formylglycine-generating enzyme required for sulfatase activity